MEWINEILGQGENLSALQMSARTLLLFLVLLIFLRIAGVRTFTKKSSFDNTIMIMLGAIMSRAVVGASPILPVIAACFTLVVVNRGVAWLCASIPAIEVLVKGHKTVLFEKGQINENTRKGVLISEGDIHESLRMLTNKDSLEGISQIFLEKNGEISVVKAART